MTDEPALVIGSTSEQRPPIPSRRLPCEGCGRLVWISDAWRPGTLAVCLGCVKQDRTIGITEQTYSEMESQGYKREEVDRLVKAARNILEARAQEGTINDGQS